jgi:hypothetical protein
VLRFLVKGAPLKRFTHGIPIVGVLLAAEVAAMAWAHLTKLSGPERRRLLALLAQTRGQPGSLSRSERDELAALLAILEPRLFFGSATKRLSPVPVPKRLLYGPRDGSARAAAKRR